MSKTRQLLREEVTYSSAKKRETDILHQLSYPAQQSQFFSLLDSKRGWIKAIVAHHLNLASPDACQVADCADWFHGSFNVCIPVTVDGWKGRQQSGQRVLLRLPLPHRVGEAVRPGNGDEKVRCEAGTYVWIQENCPDVPIPRLYGFAISTGETFTQLENLPFLSRCVQNLRRRVLSFLGRPVPSNYIPHPTGNKILLDRGELNSAYLLIEYIEPTKGQMLSKYWLYKHEDDNLRSNFYRDLSRILLSLAKIPLPRIGSFLIDNGGFLRLENRPLSCGIQDLENQRIDTDMPRDYTYSTVDSYVVDTLACLDARVRDQPNGINNIGDFIYQVSALTGMRTIFPLFFRRDLRRGPFVFTLTDLHMSNILVDEDWHITSLVDLEWGCSLPIETIQPPYWISNKTVDQMDSEEYNKFRIHFMSIFTAEEDRAFSTSSLFVPSGKNPNTETLKLSAIMNDTWQSGTFWYSLALTSPTGVFKLFYKQIKPIFDKDNPAMQKTGAEEEDPFEEVMSWYWTQNTVRTVIRKLADREKYDAQLQAAFDNEGVEA